ncbi:E3 ubiquitin-protein ligase TRIM62-like [Chanos chanos]|uniref:E3 ubiquitin-protein ligase TRIM62-like n=1 Tax=Chanos chanos TaxID=29144 RepID=A0A6J2WAH9_CHACN|nr:E3 ubiquitin-protein ligase TRIM62-like [Chanos chanos]
MASGLFHQIQCPICLNDFTDPVSLPCDHSFCRRCITIDMEINSDACRCPECRSTFTRREMRDNRLLRNIVEAARRHLEEHETLRKRVDRTAPPPVTQNNSPSDLMCPKHDDEKLKLFCETDLKLVCFICREEDQHQGHKFKPLKDAAEIKRTETKEARDMLLEEDQALTDLIQKQREEIRMTKERSKVLSAQISAQFEEMHQFLREKEEELKRRLEKEERELVDGMEDTVGRIEELLSDGREEQGVLLSALEIDRCDKLLVWWSEDGQSLVEGIQCERLPKAESLVSLSENLSLGPYESYLQFFVWKEMLGIIKPVPHRHILEDKNDPYLKVFPSGRAVQRTTKKGVFGTKKGETSFAFIKESFTHGQHYWEVEVGEKSSWAVGVTDHDKLNTALVFTSDEGYCIGKDDDDDDDDDEVVMIDIRDKPRKIGVYMDCDRNKVLFYNADNMSLIGKAECNLKMPHSLCLSPGMYQDGSNSDPLTICWY